MTWVCEIVSVSAVTMALAPVVIVSLTVNCKTGSNSPITGQLSVADAGTVLVQLNACVAGLVDPVRVAAADPGLAALRVKSFSRSVILQPCAAKTGSIATV